MIVFKKPVDVDEKERQAFEIISLRQKTDEGKTLRDYVEPAASCVAKSIINILAEAPQLSVVSSEIELKFMTHTEKTGDNLYDCWYDVVGETDTLDVPGVVIDMQENFGDVFRFAGTYFTTDLVEAVRNSLNKILGAPEKEETNSQTSYCWKFKVA